MRLPLVDESCDDTPADIVDAPPGQRKSLAYQIDHGRCEIDLAVEPGLYRVLIGGRDVGEMIDQQRADMAGDDLVANRRTIWRRPNHQEQAGCQRSERGHEQPAPDEFEQAEALT